MSFFVLGHELILPLITPCFENWQIDKGCLNQLWEITKNKGERLETMKGRRGDQIAFRLLENSYKDL